MDYSATVVLSPPKDVSKMYNFVSKYKNNYLSFDFLRIKLNLSISYQLLKWMKMLALITYINGRLWILKYISVILHHILSIILQTGVKSNLPRDDINLQFCRGVLKERRNMLEDLKMSSMRRKSLLDPQTILLLKAQEESNMYVKYFFKINCQILCFAQCLCSKQNEWYSFI